MEENVTVIASVCLEEDNPIYSKKIIKKASDLGVDIVLFNYCKATNLTAIHNLHIINNYCNNQNIRYAVKLNHDLDNASNLAAFNAQFYMYENLVFKSGYIQSLSLLNTPIIFSVNANNISKINKFIALASSKLQMVLMISSSEVESIGIKNINHLRHGVNDYPNVKLGFSSSGENYLKSVIATTLGASIINVNLKKEFLYKDIANESYTNHIKKIVKYTKKIPLWLNEMN